MFFATSIPSVNFTQGTTFGSWLFPAGPQAGVTLPDIEAWIETLGFALIFFAAPSGWPPRKAASARTPVFTDTSRNEESKIQITAYKQRLTWMC